MTRIIALALLLLTPMLISNNNMEYLTNLYLYGNTLLLIYVIINQFIMEHNILNRIGKKDDGVKWSEHIKENKQG